MTIDAARMAMSTGDLALAQKHLLNALEGQPGNPEIHYNLAMVSARRGDFTTASEHFLFCLKLAPDNVELLNNTGNALRLSGRITEACSYLDRALQLAPGHIGARCNRGWLNLRAGKYKNAINDFEAALKRQDDIEDAWRGMADTLVAAGYLDRAQTSLNRSLSLFPQSSALHNSQGVVYNKQRRPELAMEHFEQAITLAQGNADAQLNHGITSEQLGEFGKAEMSLLQALRLRPGHPSTHFHLAHLSSHAATPEEASAIDDALQRYPGGKPRVDLLFARGKTLAKLGRHEQAFPSFMEARGLLSQLQPYDVDKATGGFQQIAKAQTSLRNTVKPAQYLFVVGMPRSGTTLADQILASHSKVSSLGESGAVGKLLAGSGDLKNALYEGGLEQLLPEQKKRLISILGNKLSTPSPTPILLDTSPGNFPYVGLLAELLPGARFIHCSRAPLDTCVSILEHPLSPAHGYANSLRDLGRYYRGYRSLMQHWHAVLGERLHKLVYEELIENPEYQIRALLDHCSLDFEEQCVHFHTTDRAIMTPSASQVRKPLSSDSVGRWRAYEQFLSPLIDELNKA